MNKVAARDHKVFVGKLDPADLGFGQRIAVKWLRIPYGDFRNWDDIRGWAREIATELHAGEPHKGEFVTEL
jgi:menaquinone-dependent protoporphyrinogen oxidase